MRQVLVLDGSQRSALAATRSLGRKLVTVRVGDCVDRSLAASSRYCHQKLKYADPAANPDRFVSDILDASPAESGELILPMTDLTTMILTSDGRLGSRLLSPPFAAYEEVSDKARLIRRAEQLGLNVPETYVVSDLHSAREAISLVGRPVVIKPARSRYLHKGTVAATSVSILDSPSQAEHVLREAPWFGPIPALVQRYVEGTGAGVFCMFAGGRPIAWFAHRRLREKPPRGGVSVLSESVEPDHKLTTSSARLLASVGWSGVAMVEFKVGSDSTPYVMEVNGRFWGSLQLAVDCGIDFPWLLYQHAEGVMPTAPASYAAGRRLHWFLGDFDRLLILLRAGRTTWLPRASKLGALAEFLATSFGPRNRSEVFRFSDPRPAAFEFATWLYGSISALR